MTQKCLKATELCLSGLPVERECFTWNIFLYVIFLNHVCSEALWPGGSDHCSTPARLWWRVCLLLLNINTAPPASDWGAAKKKKKKEAIHSSPEPTGSARSTVHQSHLRSVCGCVFVLYPCENWSCVPSSTLTHCTGPVSTGTLSEQTSRLSHGEHGASSLTLTDFFAAQVNVESRVEKPAK